MANKMLVKWVKKYEKPKCFKILERVYKFKILQNSKESRVKKSENQNSLKVKKELCV